MFFTTFAVLLLSQLVTRTKKIFVGGLSVNTTIEDVKQYFDQFGKVSDRCGKPVRLIGIQTEANFAVAGHGREGVTEERERRVGVGGGRKGK